MLPESIKVNQEFLGILHCFCKGIRKGSVFHFFGEEDFDFLRQV
jgi:hypothetical protein